MNVTLSYDDLVELSKTFPNPTFAKVMLFKWIRKNKGTDFFMYESEKTKEEKVHE